MFAVIKTGGKQYKVQAGDLVKIEKLDVEEGKTIKISDVLMLIDGDKTTIGTPNVKGATVSAKVKSHGRGPKIKIIKFIVASIIASRWGTVRHTQNYPLQKLRLNN